VVNKVAGQSDAITETGSTPFRHRPSRNLLRVALVAALVAISAAGWFLLAGKKSSSLPTSDDSVTEPAVVVLPFEALSPSEQSRYLAEGISQELIGDLMRFPGFRLYTLPIGLENDAGLEPGQLGSNLGVTYVVSGSVRTDTEEIHVAAQMFDAVTGRVLWAETYDQSPAPQALIRMQSDLVGEIASVLGQPYGIVNHDLEARQTTPAVSDMQSYVCVLRAYWYRRSFSREGFDPVLGCLEQAVQRDPGYSDAWAMLGWLYLDAGRFLFTGDGNLQDQYDKAFQAASRAVTLAPDNTLALKALSSINHYMGRYDEGERLARQAVELNPHDPDTLAQLGWRLAVRGKFDEGIPILKHAIERTVNPPGWYFHLVAIDFYLKGDYEQMLQVAERSAVDDSGFSQALIAIAAGALGNHDTAQQALEKMAKFEAFANDPTAFFHRHGATDEITDVLVAGLQEVRRSVSGL
jgi:TolB-like protein/tetratricopeptide (TPR) repeat protein